ncbi:hypothetical protein GH714_008538 [Hevea brasiliensis]|uniref:Uncharacterized protein n=1 Tax=Hevea brasiliensis TaxID=3981 RepID=A0A6A6NGB2_HEVBR|nr:hypothetical protein GH714_008538 [Hevea brasiliensis]
MLIASGIGNFIEMALNHPFGSPVPRYLPNYLPRETVSNFHLTKYNFCFYTYQLVGIYSTNSLSKYQTSLASFLQSLVAGATTIGSLLGIPFTPSAATTSEQFLPDPLLLLKSKIVFLVSLNFLHPKRPRHQPRDISPKSRSLLHLRRSSREVLFSLVLGISAIVYLRLRSLKFPPAVLIEVFNTNDTNSGTPLSADSSSTSDASSERHSRTHDEAQSPISSESNHTT